MRERGSGHIVRGFIDAVVLSSIARTEIWMAIVLVAVPTALVCGTVIVLVLAVSFNAVQGACRRLAARRIRSRPVAAATAAGA
jgi:hypothetical protein